MSPEHTNGMWKTGFGWRFVTSVLLAALFVPPGLRAQARTPDCTIPVTVQSFDVSSFPSQFIDQALAWREKSRHRSVGKPGLLDMGQHGYAETDVWTPALNLPAEAFLARDGRRPDVVQSAKIERGPRRIVFVADDGRDVSLEGRKIESSVIRAILSGARPQDSFALLTTPQPLASLPFGVSRETLRAAAGKLTSSKSRPSSKRGVLDAVLEATTWLQPPRPGDSIFLMTTGLDAKHRASLSQVRQALAAGGIRVFGFELQTPSCNSNLAPCGPTGFFFDPARLSRWSGGAFEGTNTKVYGLTPRRLTHFTWVAKQMYSAITEYYVISLSSVGPHVRIGLSPQSQKGLLVPMNVVYPHDLPACHASGTGGRGK